MVDYVINDPDLGPTGLNPPGSIPYGPADYNLTVEFTGSSILAQRPTFPAPYYIGGHGTDPLTPQSSYLNTVQFQNVDAGPDAAIWTLNSTSGALNATWTNPDNTKVQPTLIYDTLMNALNFTANPDGFSDAFLVPVYIFLSQSQ